MYLREFPMEDNELVRNPSVLFPFSMIFEAVGSFEQFRLEKINHLFKLEW